MNKKTEYACGRDDGLLKALEIVRDGGVEALEKEIRFRGITGIHTSLSTKELDKATEKIKEITFETVQISCISILHDEFGFGKKRCQQFMKAFDKLDAYLVQGWVYWIDLIESIRKDIGFEMEHEALSRNGMGGRYSHPEPEDIYDESDIIVKEDWDHLLRELHFSETEIEKGKYEIYDEEGAPCLRYEGIYNKIQVFDVMTGILIAKEHYGYACKGAGSHQDA